MRAINSSQTFSKAVIASASVNVTPDGSSGAMSSVRLRLSFSSMRRTADRDTLQPEIMLEAFDHFGGGDLKLDQSFIQVEEIAVLVPLKQGAQLRSKDLLRLKGGNFSSRLIPAILDLERIAFDAIQVVVLTSIEFDLQFELATVRDLGRELEYEMHRVTNLLAATFSQP